MHFNRAKELILIVVHKWFIIRRINPLKSSLLCTFDESFEFVFSLLKCYNRSKVFYTTEINIEKDKSEKSTIATITIVTLSNTRICYFYQIVYVDFALNACCIIKIYQMFSKVVIQFGVSSISFGVTASSRYSLHITVFICAKSGHVI